MKNVEFGKSIYVEEELLDALVVRDVLGASRDQGMEDSGEVEGVLDVGLVIGAEQLVGLGHCCRWESWHSQVDVVVEAILGCGDVEWSDVELVKSHVADFEAESMSAERTR